MQTYLPQMLHKIVDEKIVRVSSLSMRFQFLILKIFLMLINVSCLIIKLINLSKEWNILLFASLLLICRYVSLLRLLQKL